MLTRIKRWVGIFTILVTCASALSITALIVFEHAFAHKNVFHFAGFFNSQPFVVSETCNYQLMIKIPRTGNLEKDVNAVDSFSNLPVVITQGNSAVQIQKESAYAYGEELTKTIGHVNLQKGGRYAISFNPGMSGIHGTVQQDKIKIFVEPVYSSADWHNIAPFTFAAIFAIGLGIAAISGTIYLILSYFARDLPIRNLKT